MKIPDSPAAVKLRKIPNISATGPACREGFGTGASQKTCQIDSMSDSPEGWPFDFGSDSTRKEYRKRRGTDPFAVAGPAAGMRCTPRSGSARRTACTGPAEGPPHGGDWPSMTAGPRPTATRGRPPTPQALTQDRRRQHRHAAVRPASPGSRRPPPAPAGRPPGLESAPANHPDPTPDGRRIRPVLIHPKKARHTGTRCLP